MPPPALRVVAAAVLLGTFALPLAAGSASSVSTELLAPWSSTPLAAECSEFVAAESPSLFWRFVEAANARLPAHATDEARVQELLSIGDELLPALTNELYKVALAMRSSSVRVEAGLRISAEHVETLAAAISSPELLACAVLVVSGAHAACNPADAASWLASLPTPTTNDTSPTIFDVDHVYPSSATESAPLVILYGAIGSTATASLHAQLTALAAAGKAEYVLRHYQPPPASPAPPMRLAGFGVELAVKKTEYTVVDDTKISAEDEDEEDGAAKSADASAAAAASSPAAAASDEVAGFLFSRLQEKYPDSREQLLDLRKHLQDQVAVIKPLKPWELQDIDVQASERILRSKDPLAALRDISQNFPSLSHTLLKEAKNDALRSEIKRNTKVLAQYGLGEGGSLFLLNSLVLDSGLDFYSVLQMLRSEARVMDELYEAGIPSDRVADLAATVVGAPALESAVLDIRSPAISYYNNLERDPRYRRWPASITDILRPAMPGQPRYVAKNMFHAVLVIDPGSASDLSLLVVLLKLVDNNLPVRAGILFAPAAASSDSPTTFEFSEAAATTPSSSTPTSTPTSSSTPSVATLVMRAFAYALEESTKETAFAILAQLGGGATVDAGAVEVAVTALLDREAWDEIVGGKSELDKLAASSAAFLDHSGLASTPTPALLVNGQQYPSPSADSLELTLGLAMQEGLPVLQRAAYYGQLSDGQDVLDFLMKQPTVVRRFSTRAAQPDRPVIPIAVSYAADADAASQPPDELAARLLSENAYLAKPGTEMTVKAVTHTVVVDLCQRSGQRTAYESLLRLYTTDKVRVGLVHNGAPDCAVARAALAILATHTHDSAFVGVGKLLAAALSAPTATAPTLEELLALAEIREKKRDKVARKAASAAVAERLALHGVFARRVLDAAPSQAFVLNNARVAGPLNASEIVLAGDFELLDGLEAKTGKAGKLAKRLDGLMLERVDVDENTAARRSFLVVQISSLLATTRAANPLAQFFRRTDASSILKALQLKHSAITLQTNRTAARQPALRHQVVAILDPMSKAAQELTPLLLLMRDTLSVDMTVVLVPREKCSELPLKRFYRGVLSSQLHFQADGSLAPGPSAVFRNLPGAPLLTLGMQTPASWMVQAVRSKYDLDNIHLDAAPRGVRAAFELEHLTIEGNCLTAETNQPTRGLQFQLGTAALGPVHDTIVMANLGYFQLKATPGAWQLRLRPGRSSTIFELDSHEGTDSHEGADGPLIILNEFTGRFLRLRVRRRAGMERARLLDADGGAGDGDGGDDAAVDVDADVAEDVAGMGGRGLWGSLKSMFGAKIADGKAEADGKTADGQAAGSKTAAHSLPPALVERSVPRSGETINVFSLASGHLYERFLKIMMLSVLKNTQNPVKFWFLKNCMSPQLRAFLPYMAAAYGFEYELVQYNWPAWLNKPTEKQRLIWAYKILFLDVLFPLDVKKIIFVDADQIVRADLKELIELDLEGAPYGYTPFCMDRKEMDGFRFWRSGYWAQHLAGKPYHISALYVVDLVRFRQFAAGDRLREQYQGLSRDPNSLANLDQDLPNNMVHQVPIKSLPQEWLWCETWCSDQAKGQAKTIDLCNNPLTKEPKLKAAVRIVKEWPDYDAEARAFTELVEGGGSGSGSGGGGGAKHTEL